MIRIRNNYYWGQFIPTQPIIIRTKMIMLNLSEETEYYKFYLVPRCRSICHERFDLRMDFHGYVVRSEKDSQFQINVATIYPFRVF